MKRPVNNPLIAWRCPRNAPPNRVPPNLLPPGFVAIDIAHALDKALIDPDNKYQEVVAGTASLVAESFRSAVASLLLWGRDIQQSHRVLVITSAHPGAGKTTAVVNLGLGLAESRRRVLLIDGDLGEHGQG